MADLWVELRAGRKAAHWAVARVVKMVLRPVAEKAGMLALLSVEQMADLRERHLVVWMVVQKARQAADPKAAQMAVSWVAQRVESMATPKAGKRVAQSAAAMAGPLAVSRVVPMATQMVAWMAATMVQLLAERKAAMWADTSADSKALKRVGHSVAQMAVQTELSTAGSKADLTVDCWAVLLEQS